MTREELKAWADEAFPLPAPLGQVAAAVLALLRDYEALAAELADAEEVA